MYIEDTPLYYLLRSYQATPKGSWLKDLDWQHISFFKLPFMLQGFFTACYLQLFRTILIAPDNDGRIFFSTLCHELYHAYQARHMGLLKYLILKTFNRSSLQHAAQKAQTDAVQWACLQSRQEFEKWEI